MKMFATKLSTVMPGLVPGIHVLRGAPKTWMAGTSPAMTTDRHGESSLSFLSNDQASPARGLNFT